MPAAPQLRDRPKTSPARALASALLASMLLVFLAACGDDGDSGGGPDAEATATADAGGGDDEDASDSGDEGDAAEDGGDTGDSGDTGETGGGGDPDARFNLIASPDNAECSYIPNGHLSGADLLNVHFFFLIIGGNPPDVPALSVRGESGTGLETSYSSGPHNQAVSTAQFALRGEHFGRSHTLTITVDAADQVPETDESDNRISVSLSLPSPRPSNVIDPLPCSVAQAT